MWWMTWKVSNCATWPCTDPESFARGVQLWQGFFRVVLSFFRWGERIQNSTKSGPPPARHRNAIEMAFHYRADDGPTLNAGLVALWVVRESGPVLLRNPIFLWFFFQGGGGGQDSMSPPPLSLSLSLSLSGSAHGCRRVFKPISYCFGRMERVEYSHISLKLICLACNLFWRVIEVSLLLVGCLISILVLSISCLGVSASWAHCISLNVAYKVTFSVTKQEITSFIKACLVLDRLYLFDMWNYGPIFTVQLMSLRSGLFFAV